MAIEDLGRNGFKLNQPDNCFKLDTAGVLLAWFAASFSRKGKPSRMLELGSGTGGVSLLASARCKNAHIDGVELVSDLQKEFYKTYLRARYEKIILPAFEQVQILQNQKGWLQTQGI